MNGDHVLLWSLVLLTDFSDVGMTERQKSKECVSLVDAGCVHKLEGSTVHWTLGEIHPFVKLRLVPSRVI